LLARPVPWDLLERRADGLRARLAGRYPVEAATRRVVGHPVAQPLPSPPRRVPAHGEHAGSWLGAKGNHLFYAESPRPGRLAVGGIPVAGLKRSDLLGRHLAIHA
ncbi:MAG TPA: hypothetical protein VHI93_04085, partial [Candidatus Thermoplasmatota archaeon]|nr:hypothetical protein [Candidatus Thermoplasmatota archaeon]